MDAVKKDLVYQIMRAGNLQTTLYQLAEIVALENDEKLKIVLRIARGRVKAEYDLTLQAISGASTVEVQDAMRTVQETLTKMGVQNG